jgi:hypothetical protein
VSKTLIGGLILIVLFGGGAGVVALVIHDTHKHRWRDSPEGRRVMAAEELKQTIRGSALSGIDVQFLVTGRNCDTLAVTIGRSVTDDVVQELAFGDVAGRQKVISRSQFEAMSADERRRAIWSAIEPFLSYEESGFLGSRDYNSETVRRRMELGWRPKLNSYGVVKMVDNRYVEGGVNSVAFNRGFSEVRFQRHDGSIKSYSLRPEGLHGDSSIICRSPTIRDSLTFW